MAEYLLSAEALQAMPVHPACAAFPPMSAEELAGLRADIEAQGQLDPVVVLGGVLIDGRHRIEACLQLGIDVRVTDYNGGPNVARWVVGKNTHRRHLLPSQLAMVAGRMLKGFEAEAKKRQGSAQLCADAGGGKKASEAAAEVVGGVSARSIESAKRVLEEGTPELVAAVDSGDVSVSLAAEVAKLDHDEQAAVIADTKPKAVRRALRKVAKRARDADRVKAARAAAPDIEGIEIRCLSNEELAGSLESGSLAFAMADPNWPYRDGQNGAAGKQYDLSGYDAIIEDFGRIYDAMADDTYLLVWCTFPIAEEWAIAVHYARLAGRFRFVYKTGGAWGKRVSEDDRKGVGTHQRGDAEWYLLYAKGNPKPYDENLTNWHASTRTEHSEKPVEWLVEALEAWCPPGGLAGEFWAGRAPLARACAATDRRCVSAEIDEERHGLAVAALVEGVRSQPLDWQERDGGWVADVHGVSFSLAKDSLGWGLTAARGTAYLGTRRPQKVTIISVPQAKVWARCVIAKPLTEGWEG